MKANYIRTFITMGRIANGEKVPRKIKKAIIGKKIKKSQLKKMIKNTRIYKNKYPEPATIKPFPFCPNCGCSETWSSGNMASYPEIWEIELCLRCGREVGGTDNSPYYHVLEGIVEVQEELF